MIERDFIVAVVAVIVGIVLMWNSVVRSSDFRSPLLQNLESRFGKRGTRFILGGIGVVLILAGVYLFVFTPSKNSRVLNLRGSNSTSSVYR